MANHPPDDPLLATPISRWLAPVQRFMHIQASSGVVLVACALLAIVLANSPWAEGFLAFWQVPCTIGIGDLRLTKPLLLVINDGLMAIFFFVVGLEIKREMVAGELRSPRKAALPVVAALGGMLVPALLYFALSLGFGLAAAEQRGWAVPMATDIAFVVGIMALFGKRVPFGLKIMVLSLAIVDDLGAVLVIALVFTETIAWGMLAWAAAGLALVAGLARAGVRRLSVYIIVGAAVWLAVLKSGVHPTVAGVVLGLMTPSVAFVGGKSLIEAMGDLASRLRDTASEDDDGARHDAAERVSVVATESISPLARIERALHPWVAFFIMPVFALANAGVAIQVADAANPVAIAVAAGLALGKPLGIVGACWLAVRFGVAALPEGVRWMHIAAGGCLAGIGFTMALFLANLSLPAAAIGPGKIGILLGSLLSAIAGMLLLARATAAPSPPQPR